MRLGVQSESLELYINRRGYFSSIADIIQRIQNQTRFRRNRSPLGFLFRWYNISDNIKTA